MADEAADEEWAGSPIVSHSKPLAEASVLEFRKRLLKREWQGIVYPHGPAIRSDRKRTRILQGGLS